MRMDSDERRIIVHDVLAEPKVIIHDVLSGDGAMNYRKVRHHVERTVKITDRSGLYIDMNYSSPVSKLVLIADRFDSRIQLKVPSKGKIADGKSPLQVASLGLQYVDDLTISADGIDAQYAMNALVALVESNFDEDKARREALDKTQFTMLGMSGSGKTCYLLGMYKKMVAGLAGFSFTTDSDTDVDLKKRYKRMKDTSLGQNRFPEKTDQAEVFEFTLEHALSPIMSFNWIDYFGGALEEQTSGNIEEYTKLEEYIKNSSSLFICVDGALLQGDDDIEEKIDAIKDECSSTINPFLSRYRKNNNFLPPTAIIVTKLDLFKDDTKESDLRRILEEAFSPLFVDIEGDFNRFVSVIPVSIGKNISENNYQGKLAPKCLHLPIFMGVWFALISHAEGIRQKVDEYKSQKNIAIRDRDKEKASWFWIDDDKVNRLEERANDATNKEIAEQNRYDKAMRDSNKLLNELDDNVHIVYFNGEPYASFSRAAKKYIEETPQYLDRK